MEYLKNIRPQDIPSKEYAKITTWIRESSDDSLGGCIVKLRMLLQLEKSIGLRTESKGGMTPESRQEMLSTAVDLSVRIDMLKTSDETLKQYGLFSDGAVKDEIYQLISETSRPRMPAEVSFHRSELHDLRNEGNISPGAPGQLQPLAIALWNEGIPSQEAIPDFNNTFVMAGREWIIKDFFGIAKRLLQRLTLVRKNTKISLLQSGGSILM